MISNNESHTSPRQRITIVVVAVLMLVSTCALYVGAVLSAGKNNDVTVGAGSQLSPEEQKRFDELYAEYSKQIDDQASELSKQYFDQFVSYKSRVGSFNKADANALKEATYEDLVVGTGEEVTSKDFVDYSAYYIGWVADDGGRVFDSSLDNASNPTKLLSPLQGSPSMVEGWKQGIVGMKIGGIREITMPSAIAYGSQQQGTIPADSPLKFVVMLIPPVDPIDPNEELLKLYEKMYGIAQ